MATEKQIAANRRNARRSTGPRTPAGKARAALNALTHGLTTQAADLPPDRERDQRLARWLAGPTASPESPARALHVARVQRYCCRVDAAIVFVLEERNERLLDPMAASHGPLPPGRPSPLDPDGRLDRLRRLERYRRRALAQRSKAVKLLARTIKRDRQSGRSGSATARDDPR
jgi:hypothetical protein